MLMQIATSIFVVIGIYPYIQNLVRYILYVTSIYLTALLNCVGFIALNRNVKGSGHDLCECIIQVFFMRD
jgi:hypothetical protein